MSRAALTYGTAASGQPMLPAAVDVSRPAEGFYRYKPRTGAVYGGVRIWFGPPLDPVTGEELDRSWRWQSSFNGEFIDLDFVWPVVAGSPITEEEYRRYCARQTWARQHAPDSAYAERGRRVDLLSRSNPMPF
jgi:hypothetical protein